MDGTQVGILKQVNQHILCSLFFYRGRMYNNVMVG